MKILIIVFFLCVSQASYAEVSNKELQNQVNELMQYISQLERRVKTLEGGQNTPQVNSKTTSSSNGGNPWRKLRKGQSLQHVRSLLGEPIKIKGGVIEYWFYSTKKHSGPNVQFYDNKVSGWEEP